ncbi:MAG: carboxylating nicotinate-nucleotide diphosphorylase [Planctomycetota bacterium]
MPSDFPSITWDNTLVTNAQELIKLALAEDLADGCDWTTAVTVGPDRTGEAAVVARQVGVAAGIEIGPLVLSQFDETVTWKSLVNDGDSIVPGQAVATMKGPAAALLTAERTVLNFLGRLAGIASLTRQYVEAVAGTGVDVYDTRKTTPGWRRLEKYAVACGGGHNHRLGLSEAVLIKDNHLALSDQQGLTPADAVARARRQLADRLQGRAAEMVIEIEVDTLDQLQQVLPAHPDVVLLDNMSLDQLRQAVSIRDAAAAASPEPATPIVLEASGGVNLETIGSIAQTGIDRISVGALTHSAASLDLGLDWST